jgi:hypothetical protein
MPGMGRAFGFIVVISAVAIGGYVYTRQVQAVSTGGSNPETMIDVTGVKNDLTAMAQAERRYWATNAKYASLEELRANGDIHIPTRASYSYTAQATETRFKIIAVYSGADPKAPKRITVDESMAITID